MSSRARDTIFALATAPGTSGIAIVRLSGPRAFELAATRAGCRSSALRHGRASLRRLRDTSGEPLDQALVLPFRGPRSFTGEDTVEFHLHGSPYIVEQLLNDLALEAAPADPGEFSRRAVENGRIDLAQAEALRLLIESRGRLSHALSLRALDGESSRLVSALRERLLDALSLLEAELDFSEAEIEPAPREPLLRELSAACDTLGSWLKSWRVGRLAHGAQVALVGEPNSGKSTLMNALLGHERVIVDESPGTTRDPIQAEITLGDLTVTLWDTAGLRDTDERIEQHGIRHSRELVSQADLVLCLVPPGGARPEGLPQDARLLLVGSKQDLASATLPANSETALRFSVHSGVGIAELKAAIAQRLLSDAWQQQDMVLLEERHRGRVEVALEALHAASLAVTNGLDSSLICADLREAAESLGEILGGFDCEEIYDRIFTRFCIGK
jgi:tRNA modification GTPase